MFNFWNQPLLIQTETATAVQVSEDNQFSHPPDDEISPPPKPPEGTPLPNVWIYDGEAYDLTPFISKHPGGQFFIGRTKNRDITAIVNIFHRNPDRVKKVLQKYSLGRPLKREDIHPKYNAPDFLFSKNFDGFRDTPQFKFDNKEQLIYKLKERLDQPEMRKKIKQMDFLFDVVSIFLFLAYIIAQVLRLQIPVVMPIYLFVPLMVILRIGLSGTGHYLIHRPQVGINKILTNVFDINYVPMAMVVTDGHALMHHPFTESEVDIKQNVFTFMLELPRYYRVPVHTIHKIGHVISGMWLRTIEITFLTFKAGIKEMYGTWQLGIPHFIGTFAMRFLLLGELVIFTLKGDFWIWFLQFAITMWLGTFLIVSSHDFEEKTQQKTPQEWQQEDWTVFQIQQSYDLTVVNNKYIDCFLTAGLGTHRAHHALPQQKSGFANIFSEAIVREEVEKFNVTWHPAKNFLLDRLPILVSHYLGTSSRMAQENNWNLFVEHFHPKALTTTLDYLVKGFTGIGSI